MWISLLGQYQRAGYRETWPTSGRDVGGLEVMIRSFNDYTIFQSTSGQGANVNRAGV